MEKNIKDTPGSKETGNVDWNNASYGEFTRRQDRLREQSMAPILYFPTGNYPETVALERKLKGSGFEAGINTAHGGVAVYFIEDEEGFTRLQDYAKKNSLQLRMPLPRI